MTDQVGIDQVRPTTSPWVRLNRQTGWKLGATDGVIETLAGTLELGIEGQQAIADTEPFGSFGGRRLPRGLAIASDGRIYLADPENRVILSGQPASADGVLTPLWPARPLPPSARAHDLDPPPKRTDDPYALVRPTDLTLSPSGDLVIVDQGAGRILVLRLVDAALRHVIALPKSAPTAIAFDQAGRAYVADPGLATVHRFTSGWEFDPEFPHPSSLPLVEIAHLGMADRPCACTAEAELPLYALEAGKLIALSAKGRRIDPPLQPLPPLAPPALEVDQDGMISWPDPAYPAREPLALPGLRIDRNGYLDGTTLPIVARAKRIEVPRSGRVQLSAQIGDREGFAWDRIALRAALPERTRLVVQTYTTDATLDLPRLERIAEDAWSRPLELLPGAPPEVLVQSPGGRQLWVRVDFFGDGARTAAIHEIDVFGPRRSTLRDLPAPFHQDAESARFLDRFLAYFDTVFAEIRTQNQAIAALFHPDAVPAGDFLEWLASWFDIRFLPSWPEATRRAMVAEAVAHYRRRGTVDGLRQMLKWHAGLADPFPAVIEHFRLASPTPIGGAPLDPTDFAHHLTLVLPKSAVPDDNAHAQLIQVIESAIPAHCHYDLRLIEPGLFIGHQSTLGVDTLIGAGGPEPLGAATLGASFQPAQHDTTARISNKPPAQGATCSC